jgi:drug/metabolite transporter (DMT)-like permease
MQGLQMTALPAALQKWPLLRSLFMTLTFMAFYAAIPFLSLSTIGASMSIAPIFVTLLSAFVIREAVGWMGWVAVLVGFVGVLVLLQPGSDAFSLWALLPLVGALFYAMAHIIMRSKCQDVPLSAMALSLNLVMLAAGVIMSVLFFLWQPQSEMANAYPYIFGNWSSVGITEWLVLGLLAVLVIIIGMGMAGAYQAAPPSIISTFEYSYLIFVVFWDILFFDTSPTPLKLIGMVLIIAAGLMVLKRDK